jgi:hypothetical protein
MTPQWEAPGGAERNPGRRSLAMLGRGYKTRKLFVYSYFIVLLTIVTVCSPKSPGAT